MHRRASRRNQLGKRRCARQRSASDESMNAQSEPGGWLVWADDDKRPKRMQRAAVPARVEACPSSACCRRGGWCSRQEVGKQIRLLRRSGLGYNGRCCLHRAKGKGRSGCRCGGGGSGSGGGGVGIELLQTKHRLNRAGSRFGASSQASPGSACIQAATVHVHAGRGGWKGREKGRRAGKDRRRRAERSCLVNIDSLDPLMPLLGVVFLARSRADDLLRQYTNDRVSKNA